MSKQSTLTFTWIGITPGDYPVRVEEHRSDLSYIVEFYDADTLSGGDAISHCPVTGEMLGIQMLRPDFQVETVGLD